MQPPRRTPLPPRRPLRRPSGRVAEVAPDGPPPDPAGPARPPAAPPRPALAATTLGFALARPAAAGTARAVARAAAAARGLVRRLLPFCRRGGTASAALAVLLLAGAFQVLPVSLRARPVRLWQLPADGAAPAAATLPVFCMPPAGVALHCGLARRIAGRGFAFTPYRAAAPAGSVIPVLTTADIGLLWALADAAGKARVRASAADLAQQFAAAVRDLTRSPAWQQEYRPPVGRLLDRLAAEAWAMPSTQAAFQALIAAIEPLVAGRVADQIGPAVAPYVANAMWTVVEANSTRVFALIRGGRPDLSPLSGAFVAALHDPAVQRVLGQLGPDILALPQTELLSERLLANVVDLAEHDPETFDLAARIATDRRLGQPLGHLRDDAAAFLRQAGQVMWGLGGARPLNALAGEALKATLMGSAQPLVLLLDPDAAAALVRLLPGDTVLLVPKPS
jgi:hypothetical protein